jgi:hypothetical protein
MKLLYVIWNICIGVRGSCACILIYNITHDLQIQGCYKRTEHFQKCMLYRWPLLWSSDQSSWLQIQRSGFDSWRYQIFWEVVDLERGPLGLVSTTEELIGRNSSGSGLESREHGRRDPSRWPRGTLHSQKLALTSPKSGGPSISIVRSQTKATEYFRFLLYRLNGEQKNKRSFLKH